MEKRFVFRIRQEPEENVSDSVSWERQIKMDSESAMFWTGAGKKKLQERENFCWLEDGQEAEHKRSGLYWSVVMSSRGGEANGAAAVVDSAGGRSEISLWGSAPLALVPALRAHMHLRLHHCIKWTRLTLPSFSLPPIFFPLLSCFLFLKMEQKGFSCYWSGCELLCTIIAFLLSSIWEQWRILS